MRRRQSQDTEAALGKMEKTHLARTTCPQRSISFSIHCSFLERKAEVLYLANLHRTQMRKRYTSIQSQPQSLLASAGELVMPGPF